MASIEHVSGCATGWLGSDALRFAGVVRLAHAHADDYEDDHGHDHGRDVWPGLGQRM